MATMQPVQQARGQCVVCGPFAVEVPLPSDATALIDAPTLIRLHQTTDLHLYLRELALVRWRATHTVQRRAV